MYALCNVKLLSVNVKLKSLMLGLSDPISNLSVISKLLERLVARRRLTYLTDNNLLPRLQSVYRPNPSTETAVTKVLADICWRLTEATWLVWHCLACLLPSIP